MKNIIFSILTAIILLPVVNAQDETDALRYSQYFMGGTARSIGMGGAFGALGGDFSSLSLNPAGIGVYRSTELTLTPAVFMNNTNTSYKGNIREDESFKFTLNNLGFVSSRQTGNESGLVSINFGLGFNRVADFNRNTLMSARMTMNDPNSSSLLDNFTNNANDGYWNDFYEELAWQTYGIDLDTIADEYWNYLLDGGHGQNQTRRILEEGGSVEYVVSIGANYSNKLYMGASFGIQRAGYTYSMDHIEEDDAEVYDDFNSFTFRENIRSYGTGYTLKAGLIYRPISLIRVGASVHLPTFYRLSDEFETDMRTLYDNQDTYFEQSPINDFDYHLRTPFKFIGSVAFQLPKLAVFSLDYEMIDYTSAHFSSKVTDLDLLDKNDIINEVFKTAHNLRAGVELHMGPLYLRGGYALYGSPYKDSDVNADMNFSVYSGGVGFRSESIFFDLAYAVRHGEYSYYQYLPENQFAATTTENKNQIVATLGFRF
jgi:hypothetical protein